MVSGPVPSGPELTTGTAPFGRELAGSEVLLAPITRPPAAMLTPPVKVLVVALSCRLPLPVFVRRPPFWMSALIFRLGV